MKNNKKAISFALLTVLFWSTASTAFKIALGQINTVQLLWIASSTSALVIGLSIVFQGNRSLWRIGGWRGAGLSLGLALLNPVAYYMVLFEAYDRLPAQVAQPLNYTWPLVLVFLSGIFLRQRISGRSYVALLVSFVGVVVISSQGDFAAMLHTDLTGAALASGSALIWATFWLLSVDDQRPELTKLFYSFLFGALLIGAWAWWRGQIVAMPWRGVWAGVYVGLFEMGFAFVLWLRAMSLATATDKIGNLVYLSPFGALLFIWGILGEPILPTTFAGLLLIIGGIAVQKLGGRKAQN